MKTFTRILAVVMIIAMVATLMAACKSSYNDTRILGTWKQTDETEGDWTWTFEDGNKCKLSGGPDNFDSEGTYRIESENSGKIYINLKDWKEEVLFTYVVTEKALDLESIDYSFYCQKQ